MKKMKFLFAVLAIVFAAGSAFTPAKKKPTELKKWFSFVGTDPENANHYVLTEPAMGDLGDDIYCPTEVSSTVCAIYATQVWDDVNDIFRPDPGELSYIVDESDTFQVDLLDEKEEYILQYVDESH